MSDREWEDNQDRVQNSNSVAAAGIENAKSRTTLRSRRNQGMPFTVARADAQIKRHEFDA